MSPAAPAPIRGLLQNFGWKTLAEGLSRALGLLFLILLARRLGEQGFGLYSLPLASAGLLAVLLDPGTHSLLIRELARESDAARQATIWTHVLWIRAACSLLFLLLLAASGPLLGGTSLGRLLPAGCMLLGQSWIDTQVAWLNARQAFRAEARLRFWLKLGLLLPQFFAIWLFPSIDGLLWAGALAHLAWLPVMAWQLRRGLPAPAAFSWASFRHLLHESMGFWLANLSWMLYLKLDLVMLPLLGRSAAELGWYQAAVRFYELLGLVGYLLSMAAFPRLAAEAADTAAFAANSRRLLKLTLALGCVSGLAGAALAPLLPLGLGPGFAPAVPALQLMSLGIPAVFLNLALFSVLGAAGYQGMTARATGGCLALNALLNLLLIPHGGYLAAAADTLAADYLLTALLVIQLQGTGRLKKPK